VVDLAPIEGDPLKDLKIIAKELEKYDADLLAKERWLVFNKSDLLLPESATELVQKIIKKLKWTGKYFIISGLDKTNTQELVKQTMHYLEDLKKG